MRRQRPAPLGALASEGLNGVCSGTLASVELVLTAAFSGGLTAAFSGTLASAEPVLELAPLAPAELVLDPLLLQARRLKLVELVLSQPPPEPGRQWPAEQHLELERAQQPAVAATSQQPAELVLDPLLRQMQVNVVWVEDTEVDSDVVLSRQWPGLLAQQLGLAFALEPLQTGRLAPACCQGPAG